MAPRCKVHPLTIAALLLCLAAAPSTQPVTAGRDTPAGAMQVYQQAVINRDYPTVADSFNLPPGQAAFRAAEEVSRTRLYLTLQKHFGDPQAAQILHECGVQPPLIITQKFLPQDWFIAPDNSQVVEPLDSTPWLQVQPPVMQKDPDGIWRFDRISMERPESPDEADRALFRAQFTSRRFDPVIAAIDSGTYTTPDQIEPQIAAHAFPLSGRTPDQLVQMFVQRKKRIALYQSQQKAREEQQRQQAQQNMDAMKQQILAIKYDPSTAQGAIGAFTQAMYKNDLAGMSNFFYSDNDPQQAFPHANAARILSVFDLQDALVSKIGNIDPTQIPNLFGVFALSDRPDGFENVQVNGDRCALTTGGSPQLIVWMRQFEQTWKVDITPDSPATPARLAEEENYDAQVIDKITSDILSGKLTTAPQVRDAMGNASLFSVPNAASMSYFGSDYMVSGEPEPRGPRYRPGTIPVPTDRHSPAGAMNTFVKAVATLDSASIADSLYVPEDKDGSYHKALVEEYLAGQRLLNAIAAKFSQRDSDLFAVDSEGPVCQTWMKDYTDDEWVIQPAYPDLTFKNLNGSGGMVRWIPLMRLCPDGIWRIAHRFPRNADVIADRTDAANHNTAAYNAVTADINAGKYPTLKDMESATHSTIYHFPP